MKNNEIPFNPIVTLGYETICDRDWFVSNNKRFVDWMHKLGYQKLERKKNV